MDIGRVLLAPPAGRRAEGNRLFDAIVPKYHAILWCRGS